jgi:hypothetical protein
MINGKERPNVSIWIPSGKEGRTVRIGMTGGKGGLGTDRRSTTERIGFLAPGIISEREELPFVQEEGNCTVTW